MAEFIRNGEVYQKLMLSAIAETFTDGEYTVCPNENPHIIDIVRQGLSIEIANGVTGMRVLVSPNPLSSVPPPRQFDSSRILLLLYPEMSEANASPRLWNSRKDLSRVVKGYLPMFLEKSGLLENPQATLEHIVRLDEERKSQENTLPGEDGMAFQARALARAREAWRLRRHGEYVDWILAIKNHDGKLPAYERILFELRFMWAYCRPTTL